MSEPEEWVSVAEAARRLGVSERSLRRVLARPENAAGTRQETAETRTGRRRGVRVLAALLPELKTHFEKWENAAGTRRIEHGGTENNAAASAFETRREHGAVLMAQERVIEEQKARIHDLQAALEHEREQTRRLQDALSREQALRSIEAPKAEATVNTRETPEGAHKPTSGGSWWARLWKGKG